MSDPALVAAHQRIADLEALLRNGPSRKTNRKAVVIGVGAFALAAGAGLTLPFDEGSNVITYSAHVTNPPIGALTLADGEPPVLSESLAVVRGWWKGHEDAPLYVVAFDRRDWHVAWRAGPFSADESFRGRLVAKGLALELVDATKQTTIFDFPTGDVLRGDAGFAPRFEPGPAKRDLYTTSTAGFFEIITGVADERHLVLRDSPAARVVYDVAIPGLEYDAHVGSLTIDHDDVMVMANEALLVLDAKSGALKKTIVSF